jgi:hypothetical protein
VPVRTATPRAVTDHAGVSLDSLAIPFSAEENCAVSFTNKQSAFYYTQTRRNITPNTVSSAASISRVGASWRLSAVVAGRRSIRRRPASCGGCIDPHPFAGITETLRLFDGQDLVEVEVSGAKGDDAAIVR